MPYSVSIPITFGMAMGPPLVGRKKSRAGGGDAPRPTRLQVLAGVDDPLDGPLLFLGLAHERLHVDDPLALLAGDLGPVVGVRRVRKVLVLLELLPHGVEHVLEGDALLAGLDVALERELLGPPH